MDATNPSRHERRRQRTRQQINQATLQLVIEKGYAAVSIQDITDRADIGRGTFYLHYKDKEEVIWSMFQEAFHDLEQQGHNHIRRDTPHAEFYGLVNIFRHADKNRDLYRVIFGKLGAASLTARVQDLLAEMILFDIRNAPQPEANFNLPEEFEAQLLTGMLSRLLYWWLESPNGYSADEMASMTYKALYRKESPARAGGNELKNLFHNDKIE